MKIYELIGCYDLQFKTWAILLPKVWRGNCKAKLRKRKA